MSLAAVRAGLVERLQTIGGLRVYWDDPGEAPETPAVLAGSGGVSAKYDRTLGGTDVRYRLELLLLVDGGDGGEAWDGVAAFAAPSGGLSIKEAVDGDLGGRCDWARVLSAKRMGRVTHGRRAYRGAAFQVEVYCSG